MEECYEYDPGKAGHSKSNRRRTQGTSLKINGPVETRISSEIKFMEVHAHSHTERKKFTHYLWEFLMLFLAVFCGFLAENQREHYTEKRRAREYAQQMIEDLQNDTLTLGSVVRLMKAYNEKFRSVDTLFDQSPPVSNKILLKKASALIELIKKEYHLK